MSTLFELDADLLALEELLEDADDFDTSTLVEWMDELDAQVAEKVDRTAAVAQRLESRARERYEAARALLARGKVDERRAAHIKGGLKLFFEARELKSLETKHYRVTLAMSGGKQGLEVDEGAIPPDFIRKVITESVDKDAIRERLEAGDELPFARLKPRGSSIRIK